MNKSFIRNNEVLERKKFNRKVQKKKKKHVNINCKTFQRTY